MSGIEWVVDAHGCSAESLSSPELLRRVVPTGSFRRCSCVLSARPSGISFRIPVESPASACSSESHLACHTFPEFGSLCLNSFAAFRATPGISSRALIDHVRRKIGQRCAHVTRSYGTTMAQAARAPGEDRGRWRIADDSARRELPELRRQDCLSLVEQRADRLRRTANPSWSALTWT